MSSRFSGSQSFPAAALEKFRFARRSLAATAIVLIVLFRAQGAYAEDSDVGGFAELDLKQALKLALRKSPDLAAAKIDVAISEARVEESEGSFDWVVSAGLDYQRRRAPAVAGNVTGTNRLDRYAYNASISKLLPTGGVVDLSTQGERQDAVFALVGSESIQYQSQVTIGLNQPLLAGRGSTATNSAFLQAEFARSAAELTSELAGREALRQVISAYWDLSLAHRELQIGESALALAKEQLRITKAGVDLGRVAATEKTAVQQTIATRQEEVLSAKLLITTRSLALRQVLGLPIRATAVDLKTKTELRVGDRSVNALSLLRKAERSSPLLARLATQREGSLLEIEVADNAALPSLDLSLRAGPLGTGGTPDTALNNLSTFNGYTVIVGLSLQYPIGQSQARGRADRALSALRKVKVSEIDIKNQIAAGVLESARAAKISKQRMDLATRAIELAEKNVAAEKKRFDLGRATNFDVLQRQEELKEAQLRLARSTVDTLNARARLDTLTGEIFPRYGVSWNEGK